MRRLSRDWRRGLRQQKTGNEAMNPQSNDFMPPLTCTRGGYSFHRDSRGQPHALLRPSVITMGSATGANVGCSNTFHAVVEGNRTGGGRVVPNDLINQGMQNKIESLQRELAQISAELQTAMTKVHQQTKTERKTRRNLNMMSIKLEEETARRIFTVEELFRVIELQHKFMRDENTHLRRLCDKTEMKCCGIASELNDERKFKQHLEQKQQQQILALEEENTTLQQKLEELEKHKMSLESTSDTKCVMEKELMQTQKQLQRAIKELSDAKNTITTTELSMKQVRLFVQSICQPNFSVVKDQSLTPVDKDRADPSGFVLVPLTVMLHGYTLLPPSDRRNIIEMYQVHLK